MIPSIELEKSKETSLPNPEQLLHSSADEKTFSVASQEIPDLSPRLKSFSSDN
jgi:hypothetical protein